MKITLEMPIDVGLALRALVNKAKANDPKVAPLVAELTKHGVRVDQIKIT